MMRLPQATMRKSGQRMVTFNVPFHLNAVDMAQIVLGACPFKGDGLNGRYDYSDLPPSKVVEAIRDHLWAHGDSDFDPDDYMPVTGKERERLAEWAKRQVARVWPELADEIAEKDI